MSDLLQTPPNQSHTQSSPIGELAYREFRDGLAKELDIDAIDLQDVMEKVVEWVSEEPNEKAKGEKKSLHREYSIIGKIVDRALQMRTARGGSLKSQKSLISDYRVNKHKHKHKHIRIRMTVGAVLLLLLTE
jgi:hypothetical protein